MRHLVLEYVFEGHKRGYNFTSPTNGFNDDTLKTVWRNAMPRGQGWGAPVYEGARSLKSFALPDGRIALADVLVTGLKDESGRAGIRRAEIDIMQPGEYLNALQTRFNGYSPAIQTEAAAKPRFGRRRLPKVQGDAQVVVAHPYVNAERWQLIEAFVLNDAIALFDRRWLGSKYFAFTTLALEYRDESQLVVLPEARATELQSGGKVRVISV
ncbi:MAG: hypothetical protein LCI00_18820 [Chloroflexi bacterium]|nr:hypothetical protein [Chloroflexota bacterium]